MTLLALSFIFLFFLGLWFIVTGLAAFKFLFGKRK